jgi:hypothetical protein
MKKDDDPGDYPDCADIPAASRYLAAMQRIICMNWFYCCHADSAGKLCLSGALFQKLVWPCLVSAYPEWFLNPSGVYTSALV